jgi:hypothetical protein
LWSGYCAEREGFEPPVPRGTTVFKTAAFDHSAISPGATKVDFFSLLKEFFKKKSENAEKKGVSVLFF